MGELGLELEVAVPAVGLERSVGKCGADGAARLGVVGAVGEPALVEQLRDVLERLVDAVVGDPELELADPGRVDDERARRQLDQLAAGRRVASLAVLADLLGREQLLARERVDERRLADARRAEQHGRRAGLEERTSLPRGPRP